jgi:hypothetical protein
MTTVCRLDASSLTLSGDRNRYRGQMTFDMLVLDKQNAFPHRHICLIFGADEWRRGEVCRHECR